jgi:hypothetical protein
MLLSNLEQPGGGGRHLLAGVRWGSELTDPQERRLLDP